MANTKRKSLTKKIRFEVFKRDSFTCQYCGKTSPNVILEVDHIIPVSKGGTNDLLNLITSCYDCNRGKSDRTIDDNSIINKQKKQLDDLNQIQEQTKMMIEWKKELMRINDKQVDAINDLINSLSGYVCNQKGNATIKHCLKQFTFSEVYDATSIAFEQYFINVNKYSEYQVDRAFSNALSKIGGICYNRRKDKENGDL